MTDYPLETPEGKRYRLLPSDKGNELREYQATGVIYDYTEKKPVKGLTLDSETARRLQGRKQELAIEAASAGMLAAVESLSPDYVPGSGGLGAWAVIVGKQTELAMSPDAGNASTRAAEFVGKAADLLMDRRQGVQATDAHGNTLRAGSAEELKQVIAALRESMGGDA